MLSGFCIALWEFLQRERKDFTIEMELKMAASMISALIYWTKELIEGNNGNMMFIFYFILFLSLHCFSVKMKGKTSLHKKIKHSR